METCQRNTVRIRGCNWDKWDMKCRHWNNVKFVPVSLHLNLEPLGSGRSWYRVSWLRLQKADPWTATGGGSSERESHRVREKRKRKHPLHHHPKVNWLLLVWLTALRVWDLLSHQSDGMWTGFASPVRQQVTLNTSHTYQQSNSIPTGAEKTHPRDSRSSNPTKKKN